VKVPWSADGILHGRKIEHFQHIDPAPEDEAVEESEESGEEEWEEEVIPPNRYPYPRFWEMEEEQL